MMIALFLSGAARAEAVPANRHICQAQINSLEGEADGESRLEITIYTSSLESGQHQPVTTSVYVASERGQVDTFTLLEGLSGSYLAGYENKIFKVETDNRGMAKIGLSSRIRGQAKIALGLEPKGDFAQNNIYQYVTGALKNGEAVQVFGEFTVEFVPGSIETITLKGVKDSKGKTNYDLSKKIYDKNILANGSDYYELTFVLQDKKNNPIANKKVSFLPNRPGMSLSEVRDVSNNAGEVRVRVASLDNEKGTYDEPLTIQVKAGTKSLTVPLQFHSVKPQKIRLSRMGLPKEVPIKMAHYKNMPKISLYFDDAFDNPVDPVHVKNDYLSFINFEWVEKPEGSQVKDNYCKIDQKYIDAMGDLFEIYLPENLDKEGKYTLRVSLDNGSKAEFSFQGVKMGTVKELYISSFVQSMPLGGVKSKKVTEIFRVDEKGVRYRILEDDIPQDLLFTVSRVNLVQSVGSKGEITSKTEEEDTGKFVVTVVDKKYNVTGEYFMGINKRLQGIRVDAPGSPLEIGKFHSLPISFVDTDGEPVGYGEELLVSMGNPKVTYQLRSVVQRPDGVMAFAKRGSRFRVDMVNKGQSSINVFCDTPGTYEFIVLLDITKTVGSSSTTQTYLASFPVTFAAAEALQKRESALFFGASAYMAEGKIFSAASPPRLVEGVTYVPLDALEGLLDLKIRKSTEDGSFILERFEKKVLVKEGEKTFRVLKDSVSSEDVTGEMGGLPFREGDVLYLPLRGMAQAFLYNLEALENEEGLLAGVRLIYEGYAGKIL